MKLSVSFKCSEQIQSDFKGCCFHPERVDVHMCTAEATVRDKKLAVSSFKHISLMSVDFPSLFISLLLSSAFCVHFVMISVCVCTFERVSMRVCACGFIEISGNTIGNNQKNLQQFNVSHSFGDSHLCYLQVECVQLQTAYMCLSLLCRSFPWLAQSFLLFLYKVFIFSQREWFTCRS